MGYVIIAIIAGIMWATYEIKGACAEMNRMKVVGIQFVAKDMATAKEYVINRLSWKCIAKGKWTITDLHGGRFKAEHRSIPFYHKSMVICGNEITVVN